MIELFELLRRTKNISMDQIKIPGIIISDLLLEEVLVCDSKKNLSLGDDFSLAIYAVGCYKNSRFEEAEYLFKYLIDKNDKKVFYVFFDYFIESDNFEKIIILLNKYFDVLKSEADFNYKLYILNYLCDLPIKYKDYVASLNLNDLLLENNVQLDDTNKVREAVYHNEYVFAHKVNHNGMVSGTNTFSISADSKLLTKASSLQKDFLHKVAGAIKADCLLEAKRMLEKKDSSILSKKEAKILYLLQTYFDVLQKGAIPEVVSEFDQDDLTESLYNNHFEDLVAYIYAKKGDNANKNILYVLLLKVIKIIDDVKNNKQVSDVPSIVKNLSDNTSIDTSLVLSTISRYLYSINKSDYLFLFDAYIMLAGKDSSINELINNSLADIRNNSYKFDLDYHLQKFQEAVDMHDKDSARVYLNLIYGARILGVRYPYISDLVNMVERITDNKVIDQKEKPKKPVTSKKDFVDKLLEIIKDERYVYLVPVLSPKQTNKILGDLDNYSKEVASFKINYRNKDRIVLRRRSFEYINFKEEFIIAKELYGNQKYMEALMVFRKLIMGGNPHEIIYFYYGCCLYKLNHYDEALDSLIVANAMAKESGYNRDFSKVTRRVENRLVNETLLYAKSCYLKGEEELGDMAIDSIEEYYLSPDNKSFLEIIRNNKAKYLENATNQRNYTLIKK